MKAPLALADARVQGVLAIIGRTIAWSAHELAAAAIKLGLVDELRMFRHPVLVGSGTPLLPPVTQDVPLDLVETRTFGSRVI